MLFSQILDNYIKNYPIYKSINFSGCTGNEPERLHPLYILTQYIIDKLIAQGEKRIAIVLPDDDCNVIPLILTKYFSNIQHETDYAGSVFDDIEIGQHLRLGKAVVEFMGIDENKKLIKFSVNRKNPANITYPINDVHYSFEKTTGAISSHKAWIEAEKEEQAKLSETENILKLFKRQRTALKKTISVLSSKNDFKEYVENWKIKGQKIEDIITYGEIDTDKSDKFKLYNNGKLDCLPSVAVTNKMEDLYYLLKDMNVKEQIFAIFSTAEKFDEVVSNPDTLKKVLKHDIPFIVFIPESGFIECPFLTNSGFEIWHWKPSTMKSEALLVENASSNNNSLFSRFSEKVNRAALAEFKVEVSKHNGLRKAVRLMRELSWQIYDKDNVFRKLVRRTWIFRNKLTELICEIDGKVKKELTQELLEIQDTWGTQQQYYEGQQTENLINDVFGVFQDFISERKPTKLLLLEEKVKKLSSSDKSIKVLVPDNYPYFTETQDSLNAISGKNRVKLQKLSDFYENQKKKFEGVDILIVTWFNKDEYIRIKQSYCYEDIIFILYDYENKWRESFVKKFDECIPHGEIMRVADKADFSKEDIYDKPMDRIFIEDTEELEEISDYNLPGNIIRDTLGNKSNEKEAVDDIDAIPILLSNDKIAYFYPSHDVIDITALIAGDIDRPLKKEACKLKKGDKILIRQSGKDIIREQADALMLQQGENILREQADTWYNLLSAYAEGKATSDVCKAIEQAGGECTFQQVRYWLSGETIMPRDKEILKSIGAITSEIPTLKEQSKLFLNDIDKIYEAGKRVKAYHQIAGKRLTKALKSKAQEIKNIAKRNRSSGVVDGIGEIYIYNVEEVLSKEMVERRQINRIEDLY